MASGTKILLVDDVKLSIEMEKSALSRSACDIYTANSGEEALEVARKVRPDLIVLDLFMPGMNGDECCKIIKADPDLKDTPVIMVSMYENDRDQCVAAGCDDIIRKPFKPTEFLKKLETYLKIVVREYARAPVCLEAIYSADGQEYSGLVHDLSEGGMFIQSKSLLPVGTIMNIRFTLPGSDADVEAVGQVMRVVDQTERFKADIVEGMGIKFNDIFNWAKQAITEYVERVECSEQPSKA